MIKSVVMTPDPSTMMKASFDGIPPNELYDMSSMIAIMAIGIYFLIFGCTTLLSIFMNSEEEEPLANFCSKVGLVGSALSGSVLLLSGLMQSELLLKVLWIGCAVIVLKPSLTKMVPFLTRKSKEKHYHEQKALLINALGLLIAFNGYLLTSPTWFERGDASFGFGILAAYFFLQVGFRLQLVSESDPDEVAENTELFAEYGAAIKIIKGILCAVAALFIFFAVLNSDAIWSVVLVITGLGFAGAALQMFKRNPTSSAG